MTESERIEIAWCNVNSLARSSDYCNELDHADIELIESIVMKEMPKEPKLFVRDGYDDDEVVYDAWDCPYCGKHYQVNFDKYDYCPKCGQRIDWNGHEDLCNQRDQKEGETE